MTGTQRRDQILDVAHAIIDAEGFHAATPKRIAEAAGVTRPVLYQQFGDLTGLFVALIDRERARAAVQFRDAVAATSGDGDEAPVIARFTALIHSMDASPATWRLFLVPPQGAPPELHDRLTQAERNVQQYIEGQLRNRYPDMRDPEYVARMVHAAARELLRLRLTNPDEATTTRIEGLIRDLAGPLAAFGH
ncbi:MAG: TetR/AcrR family transcriptional regulator [Gemmatimonadetes bacterium]|nr:TetR/AcrR family transcriptional regulator [Gemmatimonadota bacterium]